MKLVVGHFMRTREWNR